MKKMKKLFFSVFALSALMFSACSGSSDEQPSNPDGDATSQEPASQSSDAGTRTSTSSGGGTSAGGSSSSSSSSPSGGTSSSIPVPDEKADYRVKIGSATYDLVLDTIHTDQDVQYFLGDQVTKAVTQGDIIVFEELRNDQYTALTVTKDPDDDGHWTYNNVVVDGDNYVIRSTDSVQVYLKQNNSTEQWSFWISGGGDMPKPEAGWYLRGTVNDWGLSTTYKLTPGENADEGKYSIDYDAKQGDEFKLCHVDSDANDTWYPYNQGTNESPDYVGSYDKTSNDSAFKTGYLFAEYASNMKTVVPGNYHIEIDTNDNHFTVKASINKDSGDNELTVPLMMGAVVEGQRDEVNKGPFAFGYATGGYKYYLSGIPMLEPPYGISGQELYVCWDDDSEPIIDVDDSLLDFFTVNTTTETFTAKTGLTDTIELGLKLEAGQMVIYAHALKNVTFRVKLASGGLTNAYVTGDFNNWNPANSEYKLTEYDTTNHYYSVTCTIPTGNHEFKFVSGGEWEFAGVDDSNRPLVVGGDMSTPIYTYNSNDNVPEYNLHLYHAGSWSDIPLTPNSGATEYSLTNYALSVGDIFKVNVNYNWHGWSDIKAGCQAYADTNFQEGSADDNIEVKVAGNYNISCVVSPDDAGNYIWLAQYVEPQYYLIGSINEWQVATATSGETYHIATVSNDHLILENVTLAANAVLKVLRVDDNPTPTYLSNTHTWAKCGYSFDGDGNLKVATAGTYTIHFYPNDSVNPIGLELSTTVEPRGETLLTSYYLRGLGDWDNVNPTYQLVAHEGDKGAILGVSLAADQEFKIADSTWNNEWGYWGYKVNGGDYEYPNPGYTIVIGGAAANFDQHSSSGDGVKNIKVKTAGTYNIYLTSNNYISIEEVTPEP